MRSVAPARWRRRHDSFAVLGSPPISVLRSGHCLRHELDAQAKAALGRVESAGGLRAPASASRRSAFGVAGFDGFCP